MKKLLMLSLLLIAGCNVVDELRAAHAAEVSAAAARCGKLCAGPGLVRLNVTIGYHSHAAADAAASYAADAACRQVRAEIQREFCNVIRKAIPGVPRW